MPATPPAPSSQRVQFAPVEGAAALFTPEFQAYLLRLHDELGVTWAHIPFGPHDDPYAVLPDMFKQIREWLAAAQFDPDARGLFEIGT